MRPYDAIASAMRTVRLYYIKDLTDALAMRMMMPAANEKPIVIRASSPGMGTIATVKQVTQLLEGEFVDMPVDIYAANGDVKAQVMSDLEMFRRANRVLVLTGWEQNPEVAKKILSGMAEGRRADDVIVVVGIAPENSSYVRDVADVLPTETCGSLTYLEFRMPGIVDADELERLPKQPD